MKCFSTEAQTQTVYGSARTAALGEAPGSALYLPLLLGSLGEGALRNTEGATGTASVGRRRRVAWLADGGACCLPVGLSRVFSRSVFHAAFLSLGRLLGPSAGQDQRKELCRFPPHVFRGVTR